MAIPKNGKKKKSLLKTSKDLEVTKVASSQYDIYFNKLKELARTGVIRPAAQISAYNLYRQKIDEGMTPKKSFEAINALVKK